MFDNLLNNNVYKYGGDIKEVSFINNDTYFAIVHPMYDSAFFITNIKNHVNNKIIKEDFNVARYTNDFVYYLKPFDKNIYEYDIKNKLLKIYGTYQDNEEFFSKDNSDKDNIQELLRSSINFKKFKNGLISIKGFSYTYKKARITLSTPTEKPGQSSPNFTAGESSVYGDYLAVSTTYFTKYDVNPKIKLLKINSTEDNWDLISELKYDFFVDKLKLSNEFIYFIDRKNNFVMTDYQCKILKIIPLKKEILCFDVSPDNKKLAYAYEQYVKIIDI